MRGQRCSDAPLAHGLRECAAHIRGGPHSVHHHSLGLCLDSCWGVSTPEEASAHACVPDAAALRALWVPAETERAPSRCSKCTTVACAAAAERPSRKRDGGPLRNAALLLLLCREGPVLLLLQRLRDIYAGSQRVAAPAVSVPLTPLEALRCMRRWSVLGVLRELQRQIIKRSFRRQ